MSLKERVEEETDVPNQEASVDMSITVDMAKECTDPDFLLKIEAVKKIRIAPLKWLCTVPPTTQEEADTDPKAVLENEVITDKDNEDITDDSEDGEGSGF